MVVINAISSLFAKMPGVPVEATHFVSQFISWVQSFIGNYGWTVVVFTVVLKLVMSPLDIWQKHSMYKNARIMKRMAPQMAKLQKQYANNKQMFQQKQLELYRKEGYSVFGGCLPMIVTLVLFFVIFAGFNETTTYNASKEYYEIATVWEESYSAEKSRLETVHSTALNEAIQQARQNAIAQGTNPEEAEESARYTFMHQFEDDIRAVADQAVLNGYEPEKWLWVTNVFVSDNWVSKIPDYETFSSAGLGKLGITSDKMNTTPEDYAKHTKALREHYTGWNGWLIMPVLTIALTFLAQVLSKKMTPATPGNEQSAQSAKMMQWMMPIMMGFFSLFYSAIFTIYLFISQLVSMLTQVVFNLYSKWQDKKDEDYRLRTTFKR